MRAFAVPLVLLLLSISAMAELGGTVSSVQADQQRLNASRQVSQKQQYTVHEIRTRTNSVIREFVSTDGKVFAVSYRGQFPGEGNSLLAAYSKQVGMVLATAHNGQHRGGPVNFATPGLVFHVSGHMRSYLMNAYLPDSVPQGVAAEELQ